MKTHYFTYVVRLRLTGQNSDDTAGVILLGSLQQVGLDEIHYFGSLENLLDILKQLVMREDVNHGKPD